jgi:CRP-like cAMP-binding protein
LDGWAARYKSLPDGRRQILSFLAPGDILGLFAVVSPYATTGVVCISNVTVATFQPAAMIDLLGGAPRLGAALAWVAAREQEILGEHLVSVGRRTARERVAHLFLELWARLRVRGLANGKRIVVPLTQTVIADTLGLSVVHVNRTLKQLAREGLLQVDRERAVIQDLEKLQILAGFDEDFLLHHYIPDALRTRLDRIQSPSEMA